MASRMPIYQLSALFPHCVRSLLRPASLAQPGKLSQGTQSSL